ncbi:MAG: lysylphosphatidylglycerol synthase transmembrane domain-containing protein [Tepidisphaeraceae bacterium]|jgi:uncharacterized protein (TIRG00374 family)
MTKSGKKHLKSVLRWTIAAVGTWYVLSQLSWEDRALVIVDSSNVPKWTTVVQGTESSPTLTVWRWDNQQLLTVDHSAVVSQPDKKNMVIHVDGRPLPLLGVDFGDEIQRTRAQRVLVEYDGQGRWLPADNTDYQVNLPHPRVQMGVEHLLRTAQKWYLLGAILIFPLNFLITSIRWHELLKALDIRLAMTRTVTLNMVGCFYNTFMPGSTGGDLLKAYYVAKQTHHRMRAVMSVLVDRVIGLLALIILGGIMATYAAIHWHIHQAATVAVGSAVIILGTVVSLTVFYSPLLSRITGLNFLMRRLPMQARVAKAVETMHLYGRRPGLAAGALLISFPVHIVVILSAWMAGTAFGLSIPWYFYWTVVPVTVLAGSIPISPQGAGVMEYFAILLLSPLGCTVAEAVALTMSIRLVQVIWNLTGGIFVLRGGYHAPTEQQQRESEEEDEDTPPAGGAPSDVGIVAGLGDRVSK